MKILFATTNPAKVKRYKDKLEKHGIKLLSLKDLNINLHVDENGKNAIENARIKAKAYYDATGIITMGMDDNLFIENILEEDQPGTQVRRVNGKELTDEEMITYYINLAKKYGGKLTAKWVYGLVIYDGKEYNEYTWEKENFYFVDQASPKRDIGYPLNSITIIPKFNKYLVDLSEEEKEIDKDINSNTRIVEYIYKVMEEKR